MKPKVYIETSVVSYLTNRVNRDMVTLAHQALTQEWWEERGEAFERVVSALVVREAGGGDPEAAEKRLAAIAGLRALGMGAPVFGLARRLVEDGPIPANAKADAVHIAVAAVNGVDYLLTWNCKHLANAALRERIGHLVEAAGYRCPVICTPEELMED
ncbi:MAG: type II toxin-antitoxin system VapC family toxin [Candidatus Hydrogenedentota bacterium]